MPKSRFLQFEQLRVAIVHEWLVDYAGSERVVEQLLHVFPHADLFATVDFLKDEDRGFLGGRRARTSFVQRLPLAKKSFRSYLPLMSLAVEQHDLSSYDLIISSNHAVAKGVLTGPDQIHICYVHSPMRYAWDLQHQYLKESGMVHGWKSHLTRLVLHYMRLWDSRTANGVDVFVANSNFIARRIKKAYGRASEVVFPPVDTESFVSREEKDDFYVVAGRLVPYKRVMMIVEAFNRMPSRKLVVIGDGTEFERISAAAGPNIQMLGYQPLDVMRDHMQRAKAFVFAAEEDFGITPVEAQACGTPVIAYGKGGSLDTVNASGNAQGRPVTGVFFTEQSVESLCHAIEDFERHGAPSAADCRRNAERFSVDSFRVNIASVVEDALAHGHVALPRRGSVNNLQLAKRAELLALSKSKVASAN